MWSFKIIFLQHVDMKYTPLIVFNAIPCTMFIVRSDTIYYLLNWACDERKFEF